MKITKVSLILEEIKKRRGVRLSLSDIRGMARLSGLNSHTVHNSLTCLLNKGLIKRNEIGQGNSRYEYYYDDPV
jgi:DNA-binding IclR family transcriptional regulator